MLFEKFCDADAKAYETKVFKVYGETFGILRFPKTVWQKAKLLVLLSPKIQTAYDGRGLPSSLIRDFEKALA